MAEKRKAKKRDPNDAGLFRKVEGLPEPLPGIPSTPWDFKSDDPTELASLIIENEPLLAGYRDADKARRRFPKCPRRNAEFTKAHEALHANPVASAIHTALIDARFHWGNGDKSPRASFVAGWKLREALDLWGAGDELLRKKFSKAGAPIRKKLSEEKREERANNPLKGALSNAWEIYLEDKEWHAKEGVKIPTERNFVEWLKKEKNASPHKIQFEKEGGRIGKDGKRSGLFDMPGLPKPVAPHTIRRWKPSTFGE